eukprot:6188208-Pleurochrysis_carterae.AAC.2
MLVDLRGKANQSKTPRLVREGNRRSRAAWPAYACDDQHAELASNRADRTQNASREFATPFSLLVQG